MADRANKFLKDFKKNNHNSTATEDIVESLVALNESEQEIKEPENIEEPIVQQEEVEAEDVEIEEEKPAAKRGRKPGKKGEKKSNAGRKPFKTGEYKKITIDIPLELYDAMQDFLGAFDNNMTSYIKNALTNDINENYDEYVKKAKALSDSKPILSIKRK